MSIPDITPTQRIVWAIGKSTHLLSGDPDDSAYGARALPLLLSQGWTIDREISSPGVQASGGGVYFILSNSRPKSPAESEWLRAARAAKPEPIGDDIL